MSGKSIPPLTGIRGAAAMLVLIHHLPVVITWPFFRNGFYGVDLFFILSGFILTHVHGDQLAAWSGAKTFYRVRFWRVYPLHLATLAAILLLVSSAPAFASWARSNIDPDNYSTAGFFQTLLLLNCVGLPNLGTWNGPSWSLSSEALAYAFFPLMIPLAYRVRSLTTLYGAVIGLLILHCLSMYTGHQGATRVVLAFPAGVALARIFRLSPSPVPIAGVSAIIALVCLTFDSLAPLSVLGFAGLILGVAWNEGLVARLLSSRPAMFLGLISFSLYLTHHTIFLALSWMGVSPVVMVFAAMAVGWATYRLIEAPSHRHARQLERRSTVRLFSFLKFPPRGVCYKCKQVTSSNVSICEDCLCKPVAAA